MNRSRLSAACLAALLIAGCASAPQAEDPQAQAGAVELNFTGTPVAHAAEDPTPSLEVDGLQANPGSEVRCREMLQHASNVILRRCMTVDGWKRYEAMESQRAQALLRSWQGSPYSGW